MFRLKINLIMLLIVTIVCSSVLFAFSKKGKVKEIDLGMHCTQEIFALKMFNQVEKDQNFMISPLSISLALGMCLTGAEKETYSEIANVLEFEGIKIDEINDFFKGQHDEIVNLDPDITINIANSFWYKKEITIQSGFIKDMKNYYSAEIKPADFNSPGTVDLINSWVRENTNDKIEKITDFIPPMMNVYLINAVYFLGSWTREFDSKQTRKGKFHTSAKTNIQCEMMSMDEDFKYLENELFQAVNIPYGEGKLMMTIFLPLPDFNLDHFYRELTPENWQQWKEEFTMTDGYLQFPKFKMEFSIDLVETLRSLGMIEAFDSQSADFKRLAKDTFLYIDEIKHKTFINVNEEGTEAAAITSVGMKTVSIPPPGFVMIVNRPFSFMIRNENTIIFAGNVVEPVYN